MNFKMAALKKKVGNGIDRAGSFIANKVMLQPSLDAAKGARADRMRQTLIRKRESRANDKAMGY